MSKFLEETIVTLSGDKPEKIRLQNPPPRSPYTDTACREADMDGLITLLLLRHSALLKISDGHPHLAVITQARNNACNELKWRIWQYEGTIKMHGITLLLMGP